MSFAEWLLEFVKMGGLCLTLLAEQLPRLGIASRLPKPSRIGYVC
jgi:hypothetical protein